MILFVSKSSNESIPLLYLLYIHTYILQYIYQYLCFPRARGAHPLLVTDKNPPREPGTAGSVFFWA
jgi:hypothetical protein